MLGYILIAILMFGFLIAIHEFGHFIVAKLLGVRVNEFSIGMGPEIFSRKKGETQYSLRALPIGGFCAMEGEDEASDDPRSFSNKPAWKKFLILIAGSAMNFLAGLLIVLVLFAPVEAVRGPVVTSFMDGFPLEGEDGLMPGDRIVSVNGHRILLVEDISLYMSRTNGATMDLVVERDGQKIRLDDFPLTLREYELGGQTQRMYGLRFEYIYEPTFGERLKLGCFQAIDYVRLVWVSLGDLVTGAVGLKDLSGPIGIVNAIGEIGQSAPSVQLAVENIFRFVAFIAINLAVMNLLPIPALDGGQILFLFVNGLYTLLTRKKLDPKYLGYVNVAGFVFLLALMAVVAVSDVVKLIQ